MVETSCTAINVEIGQMTGNGFRRCQLVNMDGYSQHFLQPDTGLEFCYVHDNDKQYPGTDSLSNTSNY